MSLEVTMDSCLICGRPHGSQEILNFKRDEKLGFAHVDCVPLELAVALSDTAVVAVSLLDHYYELPEIQRSEFGPKIAPIVAMAKYAGIFASLSHVDSPLDEIELALVRMQEAELPPQGWPFGEYWVLGEGVTNQELGLQDDAEEET